jgi:drug/metabolite transporter (DMT)-like permease
MSSFGRRQDGARFGSFGPAVTLRVHSLRTDAAHEVELVELSPGGLKFRGQVPAGGLLKGDVLETIITDNNHRPLTLHGEIAWLGGLTAMTTVMFAAGLKYAGVAVGTVLSSTSPLFAIPLSLWISGERLRLATAVGAVVTVTGIALMQS